MDFNAIRTLLDEKRYSQLKQELLSLQVADTAEFLDELDVKTALLVFRLLPKEMAADVFSYLSTDRQSELSMLVNEKELNDILQDLYFDDKIDFLEEMPANVVKKILQSSTETERKLINQFLKYPEDSAGSIMTIEFVDLRKEMVVREAMDRIRQTAPDKETIYTCYIIDGQRQLEGLVSLKDLVLSAPNKTLGEIMKTDIVHVTTHDDKENIADLFKKYDLLAIPVTDNEQRLVGIITFDDIIDVIEEKNTEDFHRMAAIQPSDEEYLNSGVLSLARKRIMWLLILMVSATFTGYIIRRFEATLEAVVALAVFIPMLMDTGGNAGSQASTLIIRSLALGEVKIKDIFKVIWMEFRVSFLVGIVLAVLNFLRIVFLERYPIPLALTVSLTLVCTVMCAKIIGGILPIIAQQLKIDPAIMASPMITTIVDAVSLLIYFTLATWIIGIQV